MLAPFTRLVESTLTFPDLPPDKVMLYHGTSTGKLDKIMSEGLKVPKGSVRGYMRKVALSYLKEWGYTENEVPNSIKNQILNYAARARNKWSGLNDRTDKCIYASTYYEEAESYAGKFATSGSEAHKYAAIAAWNWAVRKGLLPAGTSQISVFRFTESQPLVLMFAVPVSDTSIDLDKWQRGYSKFKNTMSHNVEMGYIHERDIPPYQVYLFRDSGLMGAWYSQSEKLEVRVFRDVPPNDVFYGVTGESQGDDLVRRIIGW